MKTQTPYPSVIQTAVFLLTTFSAIAAPGAKKDRQIRFLAVGDSPPFRQEIREGVRTEIAPVPNSIPPREVIVNCGNRDSKPVALRLGGISNAVGLPYGEGTLALMETPNNAPWLKLQCPESGDLLVFLYRDPAKQNWKDTLNLIVPDGPTGSPAGTVRIVNLHSLPAQVNWAGETLNVPGGGNVLQIVKPDTKVDFQISVADPSGKLQRCHSGMVDQKPDERGLITIYRADETAPRRPVKVLVFREKVTPPSP